MYTNYVLLINSKRFQPEMADHQVSREIKNYTMFSLYS
jgi:hypothetical protein